MTTTPKPALAVGQKAADNLTSVLATDLVKEKRFSSLLRTVRNNLDRAGIVYPVGMQPALSYEQFVTLRRSQEDDMVTYLVDVPVSKINYKQGQIRLVQPTYCVQNFNLFGHKVDFTQGEFGVAHFDEVTELCDVIKKQHLTAQVAAISEVKGEDLTVTMRVIAFKSTVSQEERNILASQVFYSEVIGINGTKEHERLLHECAIDNPLALEVRDFYESILGLTWQPYGFPYPYVRNAEYSCTKVSQMSKLVSYAINDDSLHELRDIVKTLCFTLDWDREAPQREVSAYLIRAFYNFEKRLHPLLDDYNGGLGLSFDIIEHIEDYFSNKTQKMYLGSTSIDKKPWQHLVKVADQVNLRLMESGQIDTPFFSLSRPRFVDAIFALANPVMGKNKKASVDRDTVESYIRVHVKNFK